jgi:ABC-2 type transport system permease protein
MADIARFVLPTYSLWRRELVRFVRDRSRLYGSILQPALLWILMGSGLRGSFVTVDGGDYLAYIYPGTLMLILLFTAIFSTISVVEDRREGFLQGVLVSPISPTSMALGKIAGGATMALGEGLVFLIIAPFVGFTVDLWIFAKTFGVLVVVATGMTGLGFRIAWGMSSTAGFHAVMNLLLMPMWLLSGAFFPLMGVPIWLDWVMRLNPMTYAMATLRAAMGGGSGTVEGLPDLATCAIVTFAFTVATVSWSVFEVSRGRN